jgi:hypothetical protein
LYSRISHNLATFLFWNFKTGAPSVFKRVNTKPVRAPRVLIHEREERRQAYLLPGTTGSEVSLLLGLIARDKNTGFWHFDPVQIFAELLTIKGRKIRPQKIFRRPITPYKKAN